MTKTHDTISVHDAAGLIAVIPPLLGFRPEESLVMLCLRGKRAGPVIRCDLPLPEHVVPLARHLAEQANRHGDKVALYVYSTHLLASAILQTTLDIVVAQGLPVVDAIIVNGPVASFLPDQHGNTADPIHVPLPDDPLVSTLEEASVMAGRTILPTRGALVASIAAPRASKLRRARRTMRGVRTLFDPPPGTAEALEILSDALYKMQQHATVGPLEAASLALVAQSKLVRDMMIAKIFADRNSMWLPMLISAITQVPADESEDLCVVLALAAYRDGDGALAQVAVDRCLQTEPEHRLAELLLDIMAAGLKPAFLDELGADLEP
ncbi:MAG: DUF4192 domain-containing protein [Actinomycetota bacterium]|nr:DUF4192 domain-containing protein [Actinomycetota bacterium]